MKIKDINNYLQNLEDVGILYSAETELLTRQDKLVKALYGAIPDSDFFKANKLERLTDFASNSYDQVFYEFLQNAKDAKASGMWVYSNPSHGILIINDGNPFHLNPAKIDGSLYSYLGKSNAEKWKDKNSSGGKGIGSKLLYNLLVPIVGEEDDSLQHSKRLVQAIAVEHKAPILFSWPGTYKNALKELCNVRNIDEFLEEDNNKSALLCQLFFSYFPAVPGQTVTLDGKKIIPFSQEKFEEFQQCLNAALNTFKSDKLFLNPGTLVFIPSSDKVIKELETKTDEILQGLSLSLSILALGDSKLERCVINDKYVDKKMPFSFKFSNSLKDDILDTGELIFKDIPNLGDTDLPNFFTDYFPISKENHQLGYALKCKELDHTQGRQNLGDNTILLKSLAQGALNNWEVLAGNKDQYISFIKALAISKIPLREDIKTFHSALLNKAKSQVPSYNMGNHPYYPTDKVIALPEGFRNIYAQDYIKDKYSLDLSLYDYLDVIDNRGLFTWGIEKYSLSKFFIEAGSQNVVSFLKSQNNLATIFNQLEKENDAKRLSHIPIIPINGGYASVNDFISNNQYFLNINENYFGQFQYNCQRDGFKIVFNQPLASIINLDYYPNIKAIIEKEWNSDVIFQRIKDFFADKEISFTSNIRKSLFKALLKFDIDNFILFLENYDGFSNRKGDLKLNLNQVLPSTVGKFLSPWKLPIDDELEALDNYTAQENTWWEIISADKKRLIEEIHLILKSTEIKAVLGKLKSLYKKRAKKEISFFIGDDKIFFNYYGQWKNLNEGLALKGFMDLDEEDYTSAKILFSESNLEVPNFDMREFFYDFSPLGIHALSNWEPNGISLNKKEIKLLKKLIDTEEEQFLNRFIIEEDSKGKYKLNINDGKIPVYNLEQNVESFISTIENYVIIPAELHELFSAKDGRVDGSADSFISNLIDIYGSEPKFLEAVLKANSTIKEKYVKKLGSIEFKTSDIYPLDESDFYIKLLEGFSFDFTLFPILRSIVKIDGNEINNSYIDQIFINKSRYSLGTLFPSKYSDAAFVTNHINRLLKNLNVSTRNKLLGFREKEHEEIKDEILIEEEFNLNQVCFLIDYMEENSIEDNLLQQIPISSFELTELMDGFKNRNIEWVKYWKDLDSDFKPHEQISSYNYNLWLEDEMVPEEIQVWLNASEENKDFLYSLLKNQKYVETIEECRSKLLNGFFVKNGYWPNFENTLFWCVKNQLIFSEKVGEKLFEYIIEINKQKEFLLRYEAWSDEDQRTVSVCKASGKNLYYFSQNYNLKYLSDDVLNPNEIILASSDSKKRSEIGKIHNLTELHFVSILADEDIEKKEWDLPFYEVWKNLPQNKYTYQIYQTPDLLNPAIVIEKNGEEFKRINKSLGEKLVRIGKNKKIDLYISLSSNLKITLKLLEENQDKLFPHKEDKNDLIRLLGLANQEQDKALQNLLDKGVIDKYFQPVNINHGNNENSGTGNIHLEGLGDLAVHVKEAWPLLKDLLEKLGAKETIDRLKDAIERDQDDSKPNALSGYIGEKLFESWLGDLTTSARYVGQHTWAFDIESDSWEIEVKTKIKTLYDEDSNGSGTTALYIRKSQFSHLEKENNKPYYLALVSLTDIGVNDQYLSWKGKLRSSTELTDSLKLEIEGWCKEYMNKNGSKDAFYEQIKFLQMRDGKKDFNLIEKLKPITL